MIYVAQLFSFGKRDTVGMCFGLCPGPGLAQPKLFMYQHLERQLIYISSLHD